MSTDGREGLSIGYRIRWRLRYLAMRVFAAPYERTSA